MRELCSELLGQDTRSVSSTNQRILPNHSLQTACYQRRLSFSGLGDACHGQPVRMYVERSIERWNKEK